MTDYWLLVFDLKLNKQTTLYYETEFEKDKAKRNIQKYKARYIIMEDSSDKYFLD